MYIYIIIVLNYCNKLSLFSRNAQDLSASDVMFLSLLCEAFYLFPGESRLVESTDSDSSEEYYSPVTSPRGSPVQARRYEGQKSSPLTLSVETFGGSCEEDVINSQMVLLMGNGAAYCPHIVYISSLEDGVYLLFIVEVNQPILINYIASVVGNNSSCHKYSTNIT